MSNRTTSSIASKLCQLVSKPFSMPSKDFLITNHPSYTNGPSTSINFTDSTNYYKKKNIKMNQQNLKPPSQHLHMATASAFLLIFPMISTLSWMLTRRQPNLSSQKTPIRQGSHQKQTKTVTNCCTSPQLATYIMIFQPPSLPIRLPSSALSF